MNAICPKIGMYLNSFKSESTRPNKPESQEIVLRRSNSRISFAVKITEKVKAELHAKAQSKVKTQSPKIKHESSKRGNRAHDQPDQGEVSRSFGGADKTEDSRSSVLPMGAQPQLQSFNMTNLRPPSSQLAPQVYDARGRRFPEFMVWQGEHDDTLGREGLLQRQQLLALQQEALQREVANVSRVRGRGRNNHGRSGCPYGQARGSPGIVAGEDTVVDSSSAVFALLFSFLSSGFG